MHEYSVVEALIDRVERELHAHGGSAVHRVHVRIGALSGVEPRLLATAYDLMRAATVCAEAPLEVERVPARWVCPSCGRVLPEGAPLRCPICAAPARLEGGDEILLSRIEMEVA